ncbi:MAG TPA: AI-2E family transporter [Nitrolancea sp.]|nr:AI-2E family transporter [Nitrolancea sp.]
MHDDQPPDRQRDAAEAPSTETARSRESQLDRSMPIFYALLMAIGTVLALFLLYELRHVVLLLFISLLFASATAKPASQLQRFKIPEGVSVVLIYLVALSLIVAIIWFVVPPLLSQIAGFGDNLPSYVERFQGIGRTYDRIRQEYPELHSFDDQLRNIGGSVVAAAGQRLTALPTQLFTLFLNTLSVVVISIMIVTSRRRILELILLLVAPRHRSQTHAVLAQMWEQIGHYLRAKLIEMAIIGTITFVVLYLLGVPFPLLLAIVVALGELIPRVGPWLARIPLLIFAAFEGWTIFGLVAVASVLIENAKGFVISPLVEGNQLNVHPLLIFVSVLVGSALLGAAGAFVAVPAAAMIQVVFNDVIFPWRSEHLDESSGNIQLPDEPGVVTDRSEPLAG